MNKLFCQSNNNIARNTKNETIKYINKQKHKHGMDSVYKNNERCIIIIIITMK